MTKNKIIKIADEWDDFAEVLKNVNATGRELTVKKSIAKPESMKVRTTFTMPQSNFSTILLVR